MKVSKYTLATLGATLLLATAVFAGSANKGKLRLAEPITVDGKQLPAGEYNLEWTGEGSDAKLNIIKGKNTLASVPARVNQADASHVRDGYGSKTEADGSKSLVSIFTSGKDIEIGQENASSATPAR
jgi:hypothetical protein